MEPADRARTTLALTLPAVPLLLLLLPSALAPDADSAEAVVAGWAADGVPYHLLGMQVAGALCVVPVVVAVLGLVRPGTRGRGAALAAAAVGALGAVATLLLMGFELAQAAAVLTAADPADGTAAALALNAWGPFLALLLTGLAGCLLCLPVVVLALVRHRVLRARVLALLALPVLLPPLLSALALPAAVVDLAGGAGAVLPCLLVAALLLRARPAVREHRLAGAAA